MWRGLLVLAGCGRVSFDSLANDGAPDLTSIRIIEVGGHGSCVLLESGDAWCWGPGEYHASGSTAPSGVPTHIVAPEAFVEIAVGDAGACGITASQRAYCWGPNVDGALGIGVATPVETPTLLADTDIEQISIGYSVVCLRRSNGSVACAGSADQLGDASTSARFAFGDVPGIASAIDISTGDAHTCALHGDGSVTCWGVNSDGQLGDGTAVDAPTPVSGPIGPYTGLRAGDDFMCGLRGGAVDCWGHNLYGELGIGTTSPSERMPMPVGGANDASDVATGSIHTCALRSDQTISCWGDNTYGEMGNGDQVTPVLVPGTVPLANVIAISARTSLHTCALTADRTAWCWGRNDLGQCGDDSAGTVVSNPRRVLGLP